ncbi:MAG TPA: glycine cleavage system aminomethyltransferase GcvT [Burkholderiales bacterium]|nr:glycine cleavage system aminomethyltransferase GcvT [Burkholderiales bacterium]
MTDALKTTALNAAHRELGARMVPFAGWDMPLHYGSQLREHERTRTAAAMFDVSHMLVLDIVGEGARAFLRMLLANDVAKLGADGSALYSCMLNDDGGVLDDLIVYAVRPGFFRAVVNAGTADGDLAWMTAQRDARGHACELRPRRDLAMIAVQGPRARELAHAACPATRMAEKIARFHAAGDERLWVARTGYTGEDGYEIMLPAGDAETWWLALLAAGVTPAGLGARDTLRLEAGMNLYGQDMDASHTPYEAGLAWTVALDAQRDFIGKPALTSREPRYDFLGIVLKDKGVMRAHQTVRTARGTGELTSGGFGPTLNASIGLARVPRGVLPGEEVDVEVRERALHAQLVRPPFVRNGRALVHA